MIAALSDERIAAMLGRKMTHASTRSQAATNDNTGLQTGEGVAHWQAMLHERDLIIDRQASVIRARTRQLDELAEELAHVMEQVNELQAALEAEEQHWQTLDRVVAKYRSWLTGYNANLIYLQEQIEQRDRQIRELALKLQQANDFAQQLARSELARRAEVEIKNAQIGVLRAALQQRTQLGDGQPPSDEVLD